MAGGKFTQEGLLLPEGQALEEHLGDGGVHVAFAADDIAYVRQNWVSRAGHGPHHQLHGRPALGGNGRQIVFLEQFLIQQDKGIHLIQHRLGKVVNLVHFPHLGNARVQFLPPGGQNPVVFILHHRQIDGNHMDVKLLHQLAFVENHGAEGLGPQPHLTDAQPLKILHGAGNGGKPPKALGENRVFDAAVFNISKGNVHPLQLAAHAEQAALGVGIPGAVRLKHIVLGAPQQHRLADGFGHCPGHLLVAEVAVNQEHGIHLFLPEPLHNGLHIPVTVEHVHRVDALQIRK